MLVSDILYQAARACRKLRHPGQTLSTADQADGLLIVNQYVDQWASRRVFAFSEAFTQFTLAANHSPHLIGPGLSAPDFAVTLRPQDIPQDGAAIVLTDQTPNVDQPLTIRDGDWWNNQRVKSLTSNIPTDLYYSPDFGTNMAGSLWLWPVPSYAYGLRLRLRSVLNQFATVGATFIAPPAYQLALVLTVAESFADHFGIEMPATLPARAARARAVIQMSNIKSPRINASDIGVGASHGGWDYYSNQTR